MNAADAYMIAAFRSLRRRRRALGKVRTSGTALIEHLYPIYERDAGKDRKAPT